MNRKYLHATVTVHDVVAEAEGWGLVGPEAIVIDTLERVREAVDQEIPHARAHPAMRARLVDFVANLLKGDPAG